MTTFRMAVRGAGLMLVVQTLTSIGQLFYAALTARIFTPAEFGAFTAALGLQALIALLTTTGFPSYVLGSRQFSRASAWKVRAWAIGGGLFAGVLFLVLSHPWQLLLRAEEASVLVPLLAFAQVIAPIAAVQSAILRREGNTAREALCMLGAFIVANGSGAVVLYLQRDLWTLALTPLIYQASLLLLTTASNTKRLPVGVGGSTVELLSFSWKVSVQNVGFLLLQQMPGWLLSARLGADKLGYFSRANTLAAMPALALNTALTRALQPHWRKLDGPQGTGRATHDAAVLASSLAFPAFGILIVHAEPIIGLWLGAGWARAADYVPFLAVASALSIPFTVLANSAEIRGMFKPVRRAQLAMAIGLFPPLLMLWHSNDIVWATIAAAASQVCGLVTLITQLSSTLPGTAGRTLLGVLKQAVWAIVICVFGWLVAYGWHVGDPNLSANGAQMTIAILASAAAWVAAFRWNESAAILHSRGVNLRRLLTRV